MTGAAIYFPILRAKAGEFDALAQLSENARFRMVPLLDLPEPKEEGRQSIEEHVAWTCERVAQTWGTAYPLYLDLSRYSADGSFGDSTSIVEHLFRCAAQKHLKAIPVAGPLWFRGSAYLEAAARIALQDGRGLALRIPAEDFHDDVGDTLDACLSALGLSAEQIDLVLDFEAIGGLPPRQQEHLAIVNTATAAAQLGADRGFRRVILCGSSVPDSLKGRKNAERLEFERRELSAWRRITEDRPGMSLGFGDYGVIFPFQMKPSMSVKVPARIRIPTLNKQLFLRAGRREYRKLSQTAIATAEFKGLAPSWGSYAVRECAGHYGDVGGPTQWVARDTNMHVEATVVQIETHLQRVAPDLLGPLVELPHTPWLQDSLQLDNRDF